MRSSSYRYLLGVAACVIAAGVSGDASAGSTETVLHLFHYATGSVPVFGAVLDSSTGTLYGSTGSGGSNGNGVIYRMLPPTAANPNWTYSVIYNVLGGFSSDEYVTVHGGIVYVVSGYGGSGCGNAGCGTVYSLTPPQSGSGAWTQTILHQFTGGKDGAYPGGALAVDNQGLLYGTASHGGTGCHTSSGCGTVFKLTPARAGGQPWDFSVIYHFPGGKLGQEPGGAVFDKQGNIYGLALFDLPSSHNTVVYKLTPSSGSGEWTESVLYRFYPGSTNCFLAGVLAIDANGALYDAIGGTCDYAFQLAPSASNPNAWVKTNMHSFVSGGGAGSVTAPLTVDPSGNVYGTTDQGDTVYELQPRPDSVGKWNHKVLYNFPTLNTGSSPNGGLAIDSAGDIYGTTEAGGSGNSPGVFFSLSP